jgi:anti-anti-sigma factor
MTEPSYRYLKVRVEQGVLVMSVTPSELRSTQFDLIDELRQEMLAAADETKAGKVVVDLSAVEDVGSASFRPLLSLRRRLHDSHGELLLCGMQPNVREVFLVTRLIDTAGSAGAPFAAAADVPAAVARLQKQNPKSEIRNPKQV